MTKVFKMVLHLDQERVNSIRVLVRKSHQTNFGVIDHLENDIREISLLSRNVTNFYNSFKVCILEPRLLKNDQVSVKANRPSKTIIVIRVRSVSVNFLVVNTFTT